jgi:hypothetical protein
MTSVMTHAALMMQRLNAVDGMRGPQVRLTDMIESGLWIILLEAGLALGLLVFIVWWTWPRKPRSKDREGP